MCMIFLDFGCSLCKLSRNIRYANNTLGGQSTTLDAPKRRAQEYNRKSRLPKKSIFFKTRQGKCTIENLGCQKKVFSSRQDKESV